MTNKNSPIHKMFYDNDMYTHDSNDTVINVYNSTGDIQCTLISNHIQYFSNNKIILLIQPQITIFSEKNIAIWKISCNRAKLNYEKILDLQGYVCVNKIVHKKYDQSIITNHLIVNLKDQSMTSNKKTIIHGYYFYSIGSKMYVNLQTQITKLFDQIYTYYEIKKI